MSTAEDRVSVASQATTIPQVSFRTVDRVRIRYVRRYPGELPVLAGHFAWEEEPAQYAAAVLDSVTGNWP